MKRFSFSLQSILELRERDEEDAKMALAEKEAELIRCKGEQQQLEQNLIQFQLEQKEERTSGQSVAELSYSVHWRNKLKLDIVHKNQEMEEIRSDIDLARANLLEATKKRKGMELLREKKLEQWQKERNRKDQEFLDELAGNAHIRKHRSK
jgi:flagellar FliJ protein